MRRAAKIDNNQRDIVRRLNQVPGVSVKVGHDDILVGYRGRTYWFEIKNPDLKAKRTEGVRESAKQALQKKLEATWTGHYEIVTTFEEILAALFEHNIGNFLT